MAGPAAIIAPESITDAMKPQPMPPTGTASPIMPGQAANAVAAPIPSPASLGAGVMPAPGGGGAGQSPTAYPGTPLQSPPEALKQPLNADEAQSYKEMLNKGFSEYEARYHATNPPGRVFPDDTPDPWRSTGGKKDDGDAKAVPTEVMSKPATGILKLTPEVIQRVLSDPDLQKRLNDVLHPPADKDDVSMDDKVGLAHTARKASNAGQ